MYCQTPLYDFCSHKGDCKMYMHFCARAKKVRARFMEFAKHMDDFAM